MKSQSVAFLVILSLLVCSANLTAKERRGAELVITRTDGQQIKGELIAVKQNSFLLLSPEGADVSVEVASVRVIRKVKRSRLLEGLLIGAGCGALGGLVAEQDINSGGGDVMGGTMVALYAGCGALAGALVGIYLGTDKTYQIKGKSQEEIKEILENLRRQARVPSAQ